MGFSPQQIDQMSMWQYYAVLFGFVEQNSPKSKEKLSDADIDELSDWLDAGIEKTKEYKTLIYLWDEQGPVVDREITFTLE